MNFAHPSTFLLVSLFFFSIILGRYLLAAGFAHWYFHGFRRRVWAPSKVGRRAYPVGQFRREVLWSTGTTVLFSFAAAWMLVLWQQGILRVYLSAADYPLVWLPLSLVLAMFLHDAIYYFLHRWMHLPRVFRLVHLVHHESHIPSPFTSFSFHPIEGLLQALILPFILMVLPMHVAVLLIYLLLMTVSAVINHLDIEVYPASFGRHWLGKWLIGATHHSMHHKQHRYHFGLFFTFWDHWLGTESPNYKAQFKTFSRSSAKTQTGA